MDQGGRRKVTFGVSTRDEREVVSRTERKRFRKQRSRNLRLVEPR